MPRDHHFIADTALVPRQPSFDGIETPDKTHHFIADTALAGCFSLRDRIPDDGPGVVGRERKCKVVVVPLYDPEWDERSELERELKKLQTATWNAKPVLDYTPQRKGWEEVRHAIRKTVEKLR